MADNFFDLSATRIDGSACAMDEYRGRVVLAVNTASRCGLTPQYKGLEALNQKYNERGLTVLGFPCDQFAHQEPGEEKEIAAFCELNYGVTFPLMSKIEVNGKNTHPVFVFLKEHASGLLFDAIKWNFTKFLVARDGVTIRRYAPTTPPEKLERDIEMALDRHAT